MISPALPTNEAQRLRALRDLNILDTDPEVWFDEAAQLASYICEVPVALVTLVDADRQWFKAKVGVDMEGTSRSISFCGHTILNSGMMEVADMRQDERFADNPLVTENGVRFYAGVPLTLADGAAVGSLCVLDLRPRHLSDAQRQALGILADQVKSLLEMRRTMVSIGSRAQALATALQDSYVYSVLVTEEGRIASIPKAVDTYSGHIFKTAPRPGLYLADVVHAEQQPLVRAGLRMASQGTQYEGEFLYPDPTGKACRYEYQFTLSPHRDERGGLLVSFTVADTDQRKTALQRAAGSQSRLEDVLAYQTERVRNPVTALLGIARLMDPIGMNIENAQLLARLRIVAENLYKTADAGQDNDKPFLAN